MAAAAPIMAIAGTAVQGLAGYKAARRNARGLDAQAAEEERATAAQELQLRESARIAIGEQLAGQFANGFQGGSGSAFDALQQSQINAALDALRIRREGAGRAQFARSRAAASRAEGRWALAESLIGSASGFARMQGDWAAARSGTSSPDVNRKVVRGGD